MSAEVSRPQVGFSLTSQIEKQIRELTKSILENVSAQYRDGLTKQVALLRTENEVLREQLQALKAETEKGEGEGA